MKYTPCLNGREFSFETVSFSNSEWESCIDLSVSKCCVIFIEFIKKFRGLFSNLYINKCIVMVLFGCVLHGFGRAIARWNCLGIKMIMSLTFFGSHAPRARSARKSIFLLYKAALNGRSEPCITNMNCR